MMESNAVGIYLHIPFCLKKCRYCDFCSFPNISRKRIEEYLAALTVEIKNAPLLPEGKFVASVFFGGGTPSLLLPKDISSILSEIKSKYPISEDAEITLEANPATADLEKLTAFRAVGINRLSIGVQSFDDSELRFLGRLHTASEAVSFFRSAREAGFSNINIDLIYAIPAQTKETLSRTVDTVLSLSPEHISAYGLILEEGTPLYENKDNIVFQTEDGEADLYDLLSERLIQNGYEQYEISNYAKNGFRSVHNMGYWESRLYLGFGLSATSLFDGKRYTNTRDIDRYISSPLSSVDEVEEMTEENCLFDYVMMALRTSDGISESVFSRVFGFSFYRSKKDVLDRFIRLGYAEYDGVRTRLTRKGFYVSSALLLELLS